MSGGVALGLPESQKWRRLARLSTFSGWFRASTFSGVLLSDNLFNVFFQQRPNHQGRAVLLRHGRAAGLSAGWWCRRFQFRRRVSGGCDHGLRLCGQRGNRLGGRGSGSVRRGGARASAAGSGALPGPASGLNKSARLPAAVGEPFLPQRTHHIIITGTSPPGQTWAGTALPVTDGAPFWRLQSPAG